jgi:hypothetical protein
VAVAFGWDRTPRGGDSILGFLGLPGAPPPPPAVPLGKDAPSIALLGLVSERIHGVDEFEFRERPHERPCSDSPKASWKEPEDAEAIVQARAGALCHDDGESRRLPTRKHSLPANPNHPDSGPWESKADVHPTYERVCLPSGR